MNPLEFANKYLYPFKIKGEEITAMYCPYCKGGRHHDKYTFSLNINKKVFNCLRGSCGKEGHFTELCNDFGEDADRDMNYEFDRPKKIYKKPTTKIDDPSSKVYDYLQLRKISKETAIKRKVGENNGNIVFPYYDENNELVFMKFRPARKIQPKERKMWREKDGKPILWGMELVDTTKPLIITEGEIDSLAIEESEISNSVSVPSGSEDFEWVDNCWDWLQQFKKIILFGDSDEPGKRMVRKLVNKLGEDRCYTVSCAYKDANLLLYHEGKEAVRQAIENARLAPIIGLIDLSTVTPKDEAEVPKIRTNIKWLDRLIGGWLPGELSIWTGKRGEGKSTFLGQMMLEAINDGESVCCYSGELTAQRFQNWIHLQAAGKANIQMKRDPITEKEYSYISRDVHNQIRQWYKGKLFLYDNAVNFENTEENSIIKIFEYAVKRYDCKLFMVDNLMTARLDGLTDNDYYRKQSNFVGELVRFAKSYDVHVHLVAHPKKTKDDIDNDSVSGTADITNRADNVFSIKRVNENGLDAVLKILKNRSDGIMNKQIGLCFEQESKRFYNPKEAFSKDKVYKWAAVETEKEEQKEIAPWDRED